MVEIVLPWGLILAMGVPIGLGCGVGVRAAKAVSTPAVSPLSVSTPSVGTTVVATAPPASTGSHLLLPADLDRMMVALWETANVSPAPNADDSEFVRRVTLDLAGRVPTLDEAEEFLADNSADKRARWVERLLAGPDYAMHFADVYLDLFIGRQFRKPKLQEKLDPHGYFVAAFRDNRGFDRTARDLLTFTGDILPGGPGVYLASHLKGGGAETAAATTARLFLGLQISCAQCHDHPYDARYKQEDFYAFAAYFARTKSRERKVGAKDLDVVDGESVVDAMAASGALALDPGLHLKYPDDKIFSVVEKKHGRATFKKAGAENETVVSPRFLGRTPAALPGEIPRETLARAVVDSDLFAKTMVDRTWAQLFGRGIVEPWDDLGGERDPRHPPLLNRLAEDFRASGFDVKHLLRTLILSRAYGLTSRGSAFGPKAPARGSLVGADAMSTPDPVTLFARGSVRRLTSEQLFRSVLIATGAEQMDPGAGGAQDVGKKIDRLLREYRFVFGDDEMAEVNTFGGNIPQALLMWNGEIVNLGTRARPGGMLDRILREVPGPEARLRKMFLAAYARPPTEAERDRLLPVLTTGQTRPADYEDLFFALLTSTEMLTSH